MGEQEAGGKDYVHLFHHPQVCCVSIVEENLADHSSSHRFGGKYCGLAEMSGPFDPEREVNCWTEGLQGNEGVIPTRWIVAKDVEFSLFDDLSYNDKRVTQLRHAVSDLVHNSPFHRILGAADLFRSLRHVS